MDTKHNLATVIITGASGFIGKHFLDYIKDDYKIIAIARRSSTESGVPFHPNISWVQWDIGNGEKINEVMGYIIGKGGADFVVHLAAYYDYEYKDHPEYIHTNINGTKNVLELARKISIKHFLFASSLTVHSFPAHGVVIDEESQPNATFHYARTKIVGEEMCKEYSQYFKCSAVRFAAIFSDWCEFAPLYKFLSGWLAKKWDSRFLGGHGESAISYLHINDLSKLMLAIFEKHDELPAFGIYNASPDGSTAHKELFLTATRDYFWQPNKPLLVSKPLTFPGLFVKQLLGKLKLLPEPFEKFWMLKYVDLKLDIDSSYTREMLSWEPTPRHHILRRMLFLLEKMKTHSNLWLLRNEAVLKIVVRRPNLIIYEQLVMDKNSLNEKVANFMLDPENIEEFRSYVIMDTTDFQLALSTIYHLLLASVRSGDRRLMKEYINDIALQRFAAGFKLEEILNALTTVENIIISDLKTKKEMKGMEQELHDYISLTIQIAKDEIEDVYENLENKLSQYKIADMHVLLNYKKKEEMIKKLSAFYQDSINPSKTDTEIETDTVSMS